MVDRFSKYALFIPALSECPAEEAVQIFFSNVVKNFRMLEDIVSNRNTRFIGRFLVELFKMLVCFENGRGLRVCFAIEAKSFELTVDGLGRRQKFVIIERSRGVVAWIRFGEECLHTLLKGVELCCREKVPENWRLEWREDKGAFS